MKKQNVAGWSRPLMIVSLSLAFGACAAGTNQDISIFSDPPGAECRIQRDGVSVGIVAPTPGKANVPRSRIDLSVTCAVSGMEAGTETIPSVLQGGTVGNAIAGGLIGLAVDAASGANFNYPEVTIVPLAPATFESATARDTYFAAQRKRVIAVADAEVKRIMGTCRQSKTEFCAIEAKRVDDSRRRAVAAVERKRLATQIAGG